MRPLYLIGKRGGLCRALAVFMVLLAPINVKAESGVCGFCSDQQIAGVLLDQAWKVGRNRLETLIPSEEKMLQFYVEPSIFARAGGSLFEYQCEDLSTLGPDVVAITAPGQLYLSPTVISLSSSVADDCAKTDAEQLILDALTHEAFHAAATLQSQVSGRGVYGISAIREQATLLFDAAAEFGEELRGIGGIHAIVAGKIDLGPRVTEVVPQAEAVFFNSLMHAVCEEVIAYFASSGDWEFAISETKSRYWMDDDAYASYFFDPHWKTPEFFKHTVGANGERCTLMLYDEDWYWRDKSNDFALGK